MERLFSFEKDRILNEYSIIYYNKIKIKPMLKNFRPILVIAGDPKSVFLEIYFKSLKKINLRDHL